MHVEATFIISFWRSIVNDLPFALVHGAYSGIISNLQYIYRYLCLVMLSNLLATVSELGSHLGANELRIQGNLYYSCRTISFAAGSKERRINKEHRDGMYTEKLEANSS